MAIPDTKAKPRASKQRENKSLHIAPEGQDVDSIIFETMKLPGNLYKDEDIAAACAERLTTKIDDAAVSRDHERMRWGNSSGLSVLEKQDDAIRRIGALEKTITSLKEKAQGQDAKIESRDVRIENQDHKIDTQNARITDLETELGTTQIELRHLKVASDAYFAIRNRWISNFLKNKGKDHLSPRDDEIIKSGDIAAHHGDPYIDALLYKTSRRSDPSVYKTLYGFTYKEVLENLSSENEGDQKALRVLAKHATVKADTKIKLVPTTFFNSFRVFTDRLESGGWRTDQLQVESAPEAQLYRTFQGEFDAIKDKLHK